MCCLIGASIVTAITVPSIISNNKIKTINLNVTVGGVVTGAGSFKEGATITIIATPKEGYTFDGWYENDKKIDSAGTSYTFTITNDRNLTAKFIINKYIVTFDTDGGTVIPSQTVEYGKNAIRPIDSPIKASDLEYNCAFKEWQLNDKTFDFNSPITSNITLKAKYDSISWFNDEDYFNKLTTSDIGLIRGVMVNNQLHQVRLIDIDHDELADGNGKAHTTWEFVNLISDSNGHSLAYQWNDPFDGNNTNRDYINSTIRYALTGEGSNGGKTDEQKTLILAAQKGETTWSTTYNKTILSMLPESLSNKLKVIKKSVGTTTSYSETSYNDKLFMLSTLEMGYVEKNDKGYGTTYSFYKNATSKEEVSRIKNQVNISDICSSHSTIESGAGHSYDKNILNYAGINIKENNNYGGHYWLRSPNSFAVTYAWLGKNTGEVYVGALGTNAYCVAPAFCI